MSGQKRVAVLIQCRSDSSRLPGKWSMDSGDGTPILKRVYEICQDIATTYVLCPESDEPIKTWCYSNQVPFLTGPKDDVLKRYANAARSLRLDYIVRVTGDCPLLSAAQLHYLLHLAQSTEGDYTTNLPHCIDGHDIEVLSSKCLYWLDNKLSADETSHREHVTTYLRNQWAWTVRNFRTVFYRDSSGLLDVKLSVDTQEDLDRIKPLIAKYRENVEEISNVIRR